jgi:hypothetical protein
MAVLGGAVALLGGAVACSGSPVASEPEPPVCDRDGICEAEESAATCEDCSGVECSLHGIDGVAHDVLVQRLLIPQTPSAAAVTGVDIDGDGEIDNQLGTLFARLAAEASRDLEIDAAVDARIRSGELLLVGRVYVSDLVDDDFIIAQLFRGAVIGDATPVFDGQDRVGLDPGYPTDMFLCGRILDGRLEAGPDDWPLTVPLPGIGELEVRLSRVQINGAISAGGWTHVMLGGGLAPEAIDRLIAEFPAFFNTLIEEEPEGAAASTLQELFDGRCDARGEGCKPTPAGCAADGRIASVELRCSALLRAALAPDVDADGDGQPELLSIGFEIVRAVPVTVQP